jgi:uncharacterized protein related to proFAR isomerase
MAKAKTQLIDLGALQTNLEQSTAALKIAQRAKLKADADHERALQAHERARVSLNAGINTLKATTAVSNLYAG